MFEFRTFGFSVKRELGVEILFAFISPLLNPLPLFARQTLSVVCCFSANLAAFEVDR